MQNNKFIDTSNRKNVIITGTLMTWYLNLLEMNDLYKGILKILLPVRVRGRNEMKEIYSFYLNISISYIDNQNHKI
jgi:hypothetical protein